ncbi:hypothetical protein, partial [Kitasatospora arboriphila]|uniref:hypothetical protein n=1 Tax=Kitasatospora arboriphila TaxID=258052 RepID=UPI0031D8A9B3
MPFALQAEELTLLSALATVIRHPALGGTTLQEQYEQLERIAELRPLLADTSRLARKCEKPRPVSPGGA